MGSELLLESRYGRTVALRDTTGRMAGTFVTQIGEAFVGSGAEAAHLNTVLGAKGGPVETAWATALATPRAGHVAFVTILRPGRARQADDPLRQQGRRSRVRTHSDLTWGAAQAGVASGVLWAVADGVVDAGLVDDLLLIAAVWVDSGGRRRGTRLREQPTGHPRRPGGRSPPYPHPGGGGRVRDRPAQRLLPSPRDMRAMLRCPAD